MPTIGMTHIAMQEWLDGKGVEVGPYPKEEWDDVEVGPYLREEWDDVEVGSYLKEGWDDVEVGPYPKEGWDDVEVGPYLTSAATKLSRSEVPSPLQGLM